MANKKQKKQKILFMIIMAVLIFLICPSGKRAYQYLATADDSQLISIKDEDNISEVGRSTLETLLKLRSLSLDDSLFEDKVFKSLIDFSVELQEQPMGRNNPFAPIGVDVGEKYTDSSVSADNSADNSVHTPAPTGVPAL